MGVSRVPRWPGLDLKRPGVESKIVVRNQSCRRVTLVSLENSARPQVIEVLREALKAG
jgi:hypothetical protein